MYIIFLKIDHWIDFATDKLEISNYKILEAAFDEINHHLTLRTFLVDYKLSLADIIVWGALKSMCDFFFKKKK